jgi:hypothetical protein
MVHGSGSAAYGFSRRLKLDPSARDIRRAIVPGDKGWPKRRTPKDKECARRRSPRRRRRERQGGGQTTAGPKVETILLTPSRSSRTATRWREQPPAEGRTFRLIRINHIMRSLMTLLPAVRVLQLAGCCIHFLAGAPDELPADRQHTGQSRGRRSGRWKETRV